MKYNSAVVEVEMLSKHLDYIERKSKNDTEQSLIKLEAKLRENFQETETKLRQEYQEQIDLLAAKEKNLLNTLSDHVQNEEVQKRQLGEALTLNQSYHSQVSELEKQEQMLRKLLEEYQKRDLDSVEKIGNLAAEIVNLKAYYKGKLDDVKKVYETLEADFKRYASAQTSLYKKKRLKTLRKLRKERQALANLRKQLVQYRNDLEISQESARVLKGKTSEQEVIISGLKKNEEGLLKQVDELKQDCHQLNKSKDDLVLMFGEIRDDLLGQLKKEKEFSNKILEESRNLENELTVRAQSEMELRKIQKASQQESLERTRSIEKEIESLKVSLQVAEARNQELTKSMQEKVRHIQDQDRLNMQRSFDLSEQVRIVDQLKELIAAKDQEMGQLQKAISELTARNSQHTEEALGLQNQFEKILLEAATKEKKYVEENSQLQEQLNALVLERAELLETVRSLKNQQPPKVVEKASHATEVLIGHFGKMIADLLSEMEEKAHDYQLSNAQRADIVERISYLKAKEKILAGLIRPSNALGHSDVHEAPAEVSN